MADESVLSLVRGIPLFSRLEGENLQTLARAFRREKYLPYTTVFRQNEAADVLYVMQEGAGAFLEVDDEGIERRVGGIGPGGYTVVEALFFDDDRPYSLLITREAVLYSLPRTRFEGVAPPGSGLRRQLNLDAYPEVKKRLDAMPFPWLGPGEYVVHSSRRHIWAFWRKAIFALALMAALLLLQLVLILTGVGTQVCVQAPALLLSVMLPLALVAFFFLDWRNDYFVVTNLRVVHEEHILAALGEMTKDQAPLGRIQNVNIYKSGPMANIYNFGDVVIDTAGLGRVTFDMAPDPEYFRKAIQELSRKAGRRSAAERRSQIREQIEQRLGGFRLQRTGPEEDLEAEDVEPPAQSSEARPTPQTPEREWLRAFWEKAREYFSLRVRVERDGTVTYRKHWVVLLQATWKPAALLTLFTVLFITRLLDAWPGFLLPLQQALTPGLAFVAFFVAALVLLAWLWWGFENWRNDLFQVTPEFVVDSKMMPLFFGERTLKRAPLQNIQDVTARTPNFISRLFGMGTVVLQTAGAEGALEWEHIYHPFAVADDVFRRVKTFQMQQEEARELEQAELLSEWFAIYHQTTHPEDYAASDEEIEVEHPREVEEETPPPPPQDDYSLF